MCNSVSIKANEGKLYLRILTSIMSIATAVSKKKKCLLPYLNTISTACPEEKNPPRKQGEEMDLWVYVTERRRKMWRN